MAIVNHETLPQLLAILESTKQNLSVKAGSLYIQRVTFEQLVKDFKHFVEVYNGLRASTCLRELQRYKKSICENCIKIFSLKELTVYYLETETHVPTLFYSESKKLVRVCEDCAESLTKKTAQQKPRPDLADMLKRDFEEDEGFEGVTFMSLAEKNKKLYYFINQKGEKQPVPEDSYIDDLKVIQALPDEIFAELHIPPKAIYNSKENTLTIGGTITPC